MNAIVKNERELTILMTEISNKLLIYLSKEVMRVMREELSKAAISTKSMQDGVDFKISAGGTEATIFVNYDYIEAFHSRMPVYADGNMVAWGWFRNSFGRQKGETTWRGAPIAFRMAEWLEDGGKGSIGNQPIPATHWFTKAVKEVELNLDKWINKFFSKKI